MKYLLDTCVLTQLGSPDGEPAVRDFVSGLPEQDVYLSALTIGEIHRGIELLSEGKRKANLFIWLDAIQSRYADRVLDIDVATASAWGSLTANAKRRGFELPAIDALLAATAIRHGLQVVTRNEKDFIASGVSHVNPWR